MRRPQRVHVKRGITKPLHDGATGADERIALARFRALKWHAKRGNEEDVARLRRAIREAVNVVKQPSAAALARVSPVVEHVAKRASFGATVRRFFLRNRER